MDARTAARQMALDKDLALEDRNGSASCGIKGAEGPVGAIGFCMVGLAGHALGRFGRRTGCGRSLHHSRKCARLAKGANG